MDCVCVCAPVASYLLLPGHSVDTHSKKPLVVIHSVTQPWKKNVTIRGRQKQRGRKANWKRQVVWVCGPTIHMLAQTDVFPGIPHTGRHISAHTVSATLPQLPFIWIHLTERHQ